MALGGAEFSADHSRIGGIRRLPRRQSRSIVAAEMSSDRLECLRRRLRQPGAWRFPDEPDLT
jgi:hypothetical protein